MFRYAFDLNAPVTLEANKLDPQSVVNALSTTFKCNVFIDGFIDDTPVGKPGVYRAQDVLKMACSAWKCTQEAEGKNLYFLRDLSPKDRFPYDKPDRQYPAVSQEEMVAVTTAINERLPRKQTYQANRMHNVGSMEQLRTLLQQMSPAERKKADSKEGIVIGSLPAPLQQEFVKSIRLQGHESYDMYLRQWVYIQPVLENLKSLSANLDSNGKIQFSAPGKQFGLTAGGSGEWPGQSKVDTVQALMEKGCTRVTDYAKKTTLQAPPEIQRHFITAAALVDEPAFFAALAKLNGWKYRQESANRVSLQPVKPDPSDGIRPLLPAEFQRYLLAPGPDIIYNIMPMVGTYVGWRGLDLRRDSSLYSRLFHKLAGKRDSLELRTATEQETYALTRMLFSDAASSLGYLVTQDKFSLPYLEDYKNAVLTTNSHRNTFGVNHPKGGGFSAGDNMPGLITGW